MARSGQRKMFANYETPANENLTGGFGEGRYLIIKDEYRDKLWQGMKGTGEALIDVVPYQMTFPCGVSVDIEPKTKPKDKQYDNNGCHINKNPGDWVFQLNYWVHTNIGPLKKTVVCPRTFGKPCPICEKEQALLSSWPYPKGSEASSDYYKQVVAPLKTKNRTLFNINLEEEGAKKSYLWDSSWFFIPKALLSINTDPRTKEPIFWFDPDDGKSIYFKFSNFDKNETKPEVSGVQFINRDTPIPDDVIDAAIALETVLIETSYDDIVEMMNATSYVENNEAEVEDNAERYASASEQLDAVFGKSSKENPKEDASDTEETVSTEVNDSQRRRRNPELSKIRAFTSEKELDDYCEEKGIEVYPQEYSSFEEFKEAVIEWSSNQEAPF